MVGRTYKRAAMWWPSYGGRTSSVSRNSGIGAFRSSSTFPKQRWRYPSICLERLMPSHQRWIRKRAQSWRQSQPDTGIPRNQSPAVRLVKTVLCSDLAPLRLSVGEIIMGCQQRRVDSTPLPTMKRHCRDGPSMNHLLTELLGGNLMWCDGCLLNPVYPVVEPLISDYRTANQ
jgi:hypothetical protein